MLLLHQKMSILKVRLRAEMKQWGALGRRLTQVKNESGRRPTMDRRTFLSWVGVSWVATSLPVALAACSAGSSTREFQAVGLLAELDKTGVIQTENFPTGPVVIIRDPAKRDNILAFNATCSHNGCLVNWKKEQKVFICPCHNSAFAPDGRVLHGPATKPLVAYTAKASGDFVAVKGS
jgi:cytochrome b6-f complex iron-sulfur subunit